MRIAENGHIAQGYFKQQSDIFIRYLKICIFLKFIRSNIQLIFIISKFDWCKGYLYKFYDLIYLSNSTN